MRRKLRRFAAVLKKIQNPFYDLRLFDTGDHFDGTAALLTGFDIDLEHVIYPKQTLKYLHLEGPERVVLRRSLQTYSTDRLRRISSQSDS